MEKFEVYDSDKNFRGKNKHVMFLVSNALENALIYQKF